jgi:hypothetical protein
MKIINSLIPIALLICVFGLTSCEKDILEIPEHFNIDEYTGRYIFDIKLDVLRDGELTTEIYESVGYVTKESEYRIKILFDFAAPKVNCVYDYAVRPDGTFYSIYRGAGDRTGKFYEKTVEFEEFIDLGSGNYKKLEFIGLTNNQ